MFRTIGDRPSLWESRLPAEVLRLPEDLARVDVLLDDPVFFAPFAPYFQPVIGRPSTPVECYPRLMFLKFRHRLGFESLCAEVSDSISWRRFCRIPLDAKVPHPATLMKLTSRCGEAAVAGLNEALWAKAAGDKLLRTTRVRADTTVICANVAYPTDSGLLAKAVGKLVRTARRVRAAGGAPATAMTDRRPSSSGTKPRSPTTTTASSSTTTSNTAPLPTARNLRPPSSGSTAAPAARRAVTADRGYGRAAFERDLHDLGVRTVAIPRQGKISAARSKLEHSRSFHRLVKWRTGCEGRISYLKRGYGSDRTRLDTRHGAAIWCGHGVFAHNLVKIAALAS